MRQIRLGNIIVEPERHRIVKEDEVHRVTAREMDVLAYLIQHGTRVVPRKAFLDSVWNDVVVNDEALTLVISRLRAVFSDDPTCPRVIETIPKRGYRLMIEAVDVTAPKSTAEAKQIRWVGVTVLAILLIVMTVLFTIVRVEYGRVGVVKTETVAPSEGSP